MTPRMIFFLLVGIAVVLEIAADIFFKKWALDNRQVLLILGLLLYAAGTVFWAYSLKYEYLSKAVVLFTLLNLIAITLAGVILFKEHLTALNKVGIALGILSIFLL